MLSTDPLFLVFLTTGFAVGFGHCIGMCGPIVVAMSMNMKSGSGLVPHLFYHIGRISTYTILGGIMGVTGSFAMVTAEIANFQKGVLIFSGLLIIFMGIITGGWMPRFSAFTGGSSMSAFFSRHFNALLSLKSASAYFPLGLLLGLLPCGPVYTVLLASARAGMDAGDPVRAFIKGMTLTLAFGIGTIPALFLIGRLAGMGWFRKRMLIYKIGSVIMIAVGGYFVFRAVQY